MSSVDSVLNSSSEAYYDPAADFSGVMPEGTYKAYATELIVKEDLVVNVERASLEKFKHVLAFCESQTNSNSS